MKIIISLISIIIQLNVQLFFWLKQMLLISYWRDMTDCRENSLFNTFTVIRPIKTDDAGAVDGGTEGEAAITMLSDFNRSMACSHWQIRHLQQQCLDENNDHSISQKCSLRNTKHKLICTWALHSKDQRTENLPSPPHLPPPPSDTGSSILSMAISQRDPHNPTDVEVLDLYHPLTKTSDLVVSDLPSELLLSIWSDVFICTPSEWLNC